MALQVLWSYGTLNSRPNVSGVYVLYDQVTGRRRAIYVGRGDVGPRFSAHSRDPSITKYGLNNMLTAWASVSESNQPSVERYLHEQLKPMESTSNHPFQTPVNLPW